VRELRLRKGWTAEDLASRAGVSGRTIYDVEGGYRQPRRATLAVLAIALGCRPENLTQPEDDHDPEASRAAEGVRGCVTQLAE
jgi:transcriptional regulator with XRE-family HTH domain